MAANAHLTVSSDGDRFAPRALPDGAVSLRMASAADALCIAVLGYQVFLDTYATQGIRPLLAREVLSQFEHGVVSDLLATPGRVFLLAEREAHLIAFAQVAVGPTCEQLQGPSAELERLYVQAPFAGQGLGKQLLRHSEEWAASQGAASLWLTAWVGNARALAFYAAQGYAALGSTDYVFETEAHENTVFGKVLGRA